MSNNRFVLGIELGSTRIKSTLITPEGAPVASGSYAWENAQVDGVWTYDLDDAWHGVAECVADLRRNADDAGAALADCAAIGISGMMHGYLALDENDELLVPFRTWRNNMTAQAASELTSRFGYPIPQRWSIAHLYQAMLNGEEHLSRVAKITTLAGYIHYRLTGRFVLGMNEASGMFPIDVETQEFDSTMIEQFDELVADRGFAWRLRDILPEIVAAGEVAGRLTQDGAHRLGPEGALPAETPLCPPEGDAGTGMIATNAIRPRGGNVSAGTSVFAMIVLERPLSTVHEEIDLVATPDGKAVAMVHSNNCTSDIDAWISLFVQAANALGADVTDADGFARLLPLALKGESDAGGLLSYGYVSGEHVTGFSEGRPLFVRRPDAPLSLPNVLRSHLLSSLCALRTGLNILTQDEGVRVTEIRGHGGFFKTPEVGQRIMAAAVEAPVSVMETAGEGGAWGMALLASYMLAADGQTLADYLDALFADNQGSIMQPDAQDVNGFRTYFERYTAGLPIERAAVEAVST